MEPAPPSPFITRVRLRQYRSLADCDVVLGPLALLVGPNGSGKSNFLDALALTADALRGSLDQALRSRGGLRAVQHLSPRASGPLEIAVEFQLAPGCPGDYVFAVEALPSGGFQVIRRLRSEAPKRLERIETYLRVILPAFRGVETVSIGGFETLEFTLEVEGREQRFPVTSISDGTLRALTILVSVLGAAATGAVSLVGVEEPEKAIHPAAAAAMADAFFETSRSVQVIVTTHSPELLDHDIVKARDLIAVVSEEGVTRLGVLDPFGLSALRDRLCTPGELQRQGHLLPRMSLAES